MSGLISVRTKISFDADNLRSQFDKRTRRNIAYAAGIVRRTASRSMRRRKKHSAPGTPPSKRRGDFAKSIRYELDTSARVARIGPTANKYLNKAHEFGGIFTGAQLKGDRTRSSNTKGSRQQDKQKKRYPARPYMGPALQKSLPDILAAMARE